MFNLYEKEMTPIFLPIFLRKAVLPEKSERSESPCSGDTPGILQRRTQDFISEVIQPITKHWLGGNAISANQVIQILPDILQEPTRDRVSFAHRPILSVKLEQGRYTCSLTESPQLIPLVQEASQTVQTLDL